MLRLKVEPVKVIEFLKANPGRSSRDVSFFLLEQAADEIAETDGGESAGDNLALRIIEEALDWSIGIKVVCFLRDCAKLKKRPKPFTLEVERAGRMCARFESGTRVVL